MKKRALALLSKAHVLYLASRDSRTPRYAKMVGLGAILWVIVPADFDFIPLLGWIDDATMLTLATGLIARVTPDEVLMEKREESPKRLRQFVIRSIVVGIAFTVLLGYILWKIVG